MTMSQVSFTLLLIVAFCGTFAPSQAQDEPRTNAAIYGNFAIMSDGTKIHYLSAGRMTAEPSIVLIPGWTLPAALWNHQLQRFSESHLVIAVDSRSQGESSIAPSGNTPERRAVDLHELITSLHIGRFVIVGWSQGAQDVAAYIDEFGTDSLAAIVFVDAAVSNGPATIEARGKLSLAVLGRLGLLDSHPTEYSEGLVHYIFRKPHPDLDMQQIIDESRKTPPSIGIAMLVMDIFGADRRPALRKINRPTLVISSAFSPELAEQKEMANTIPGARQVVVSDAGHALFVDAPDRFDEELTRLLQAAGPAAH